MADHIHVCLGMGWRTIDDAVAPWREQLGICACGCEHFGPVLKDHWWEAICDDPLEVLCMECMRERLNIWTFTSDLLKDIPWNMLWRAKWGEG